MALPDRLGKVVPGPKKCLLGTSWAFGIVAEETRGRAEDHVPIGENKRLNWAGSPCISVTGRAESCREHPGPVWKVSAIFACRFPRRVVEGNPINGRIPGLDGTLPLALPPGVDWVVRPGINGSGVLTMVLRIFSSAPEPTQ